MNTLVLQKFLSVSPAQRAQLVGNVASYVSDNGFVNLFSALDVNDTWPSNKTRPSNIHFVAQMIAAYNRNPDVVKQVKEWLAQV